MNKSKIAIGVLIAVGAAWCGGAWFTGKTAETEYKKQIEKTNRQLHSLGLSVEFKNKQFERGLFSSQVEDEIVIGDAKNGEQSIIPLSTQIYHGPLPLNQVVKFNLAPMMYAAEGFIAKNETTEPLFSLIKSDKPIQYKASTNYSLKSTSQIDIAAGEKIDLGEAKGKITWSDIHLNFELDKEALGIYTFAMNDLLIDLSGEDSGKFKAHWKDISVNGDMQPTQWSSLFTGKSESNIALVEMESTNHLGIHTSLVQKGSKTLANVALNGDFLDIRSVTDIDALNFNNQDFGKFSYGLELNHIDAESMNQLGESLVAIFKQPQNENQFTENANLLLSNWLQEYGIKIFNNQPQLKINPMQMTDEKGKLAFDLNIALAKNPNFDLMKKGGLFQQFSDFAVNIHLDKATLENVLNKIAKSVPTSQNTELDVKAKIDEMSEEMSKNGVMVNNQDNLTMKLVLENSKLTLNGETIPEEQAQMMLFMLLLSQMGNLPR